MTFFRSFTFPLWEIFAGNMLLLICTLFYLAWWAVSFRPNTSGVSAGTLYIIAAIITGCAAIALISGGINSLPQGSRGLPVWVILTGVAALFIVLFLVTSLAFHRIVTSELLIIHIWAALELSVVAALYGTGHLGVGRAAILAALVGIATIAGLICYVLYYRADETARYYIGMVPLITDAVVMAIFLVILAVS